MFVVIKTFEVEKSGSGNFINRLKQKSPLLTFEDFIHREISINQKDEMVDSVEVRILFKDQKAYYRWEGSDAHIKMHQEKREKPVGVKVIGHQYFTRVAYDSYEAT